MFYGSICHDVCVCVRVCVCVCLSDSVIIIENEIISFHITVPEAK